MYIVLKVDDEEVEYFVERLNEDGYTITHIQKEDE